MDPGLLKAYPRDEAENLGLAMKGRFGQCQVDESERVSFRVDCGVKCVCRRCGANFGPNVRDGSCESTDPGGVDDLNDGSNDAATARRGNNAPTTSLTRFS